MLHMPATAYQIFPCHKYHLGVNLRGETSYSDSVLAHFPGPSILMPILNLT